MSITMRKLLSDLTLDEVLYRVAENEKLAREIAYAIASAYFYFEDANNTLEQICAASLFLEDSLVCQTLATYIVPYATYLPKEIPPLKFFLEKAHKIPDEYKETIRYFFRKIDLMSYLIGEPYYLQKFKEMYSVQGCNNTIILTEPTMQIHLYLYEDHAFIHFHNEEMEYESYIRYSEFPALEVLAGICWDEVGE